MDVGAFAREDERDCRSRSKPPERAKKLGLRGENVRGEMWEKVAKIKIFGF